VFNVKLVLPLFISLGLMFSVSAIAALSDPTKPAYLKKRKIVKKLVIKKKAKPLVVKSILLSGSRRLAVINNSVVAVGDKLGSVKVVEINRNYVVVLRNSKRVILSFGKVVARESKSNSKK